MKASVETEARKLFASARTHDERAVLLQAVSDGYHKYEKRDFRALLSRDNVTFTAYSEHITNAFTFGNTLESAEEFELVVTVASETLEYTEGDADHG